MKRFTWIAWGVVDVLMVVANVATRNAFAAACWAFSAGISFSVLVAFHYLGQDES